jgi:predicted P-loop ATPase
MPDLDEVLRNDPDALAKLIAAAQKTKPMEPDLEAVRNRIKGELIYNYKGDQKTTPKQNLAKNVQLVLETDPEFAGKLWTDLWSGARMWGDRELRDVDMTRARIRIGELYHFEPSKQVSFEVADIVADENGKNPVTDYLNSLDWDGVSRVGDWAAQSLDAEDSKLNRMICRKFFIQLVARALTPGCKADTVLTLVGAQGAGKSSVLRALAGGGDYFNDSAIDIGSRQAFIQLHSAWIYELAEFDSIRRKDINTIKAFISALWDKYVPPYGKNVVTQKRHTIFVASVNNPEFLTDPTGARRFWPITVGEDINQDWTKANRGQLFAEAVHLFRKGEPWWLDRGYEKMLKRRHVEHTLGDSIEELVDKWVVQTIGRTFTLAECLTGIHKPNDRVHEMRVSDALRAIGYEKFRRGNRNYWRKSNIINLEDHNTNDDDYEETTGSRS